jgi:ribose transport system substrate-binding protein
LTNPDVRRLITGLLPFLLVLLPVSLACAAGPISIAMISKGTQPPFWQAVMRGAMNASRDNNVVVTYEGPENESMVDGQIGLLSDALSKNPSAICIDALDSAAVMPLLQEARKRKIPVIGFDAGVDGTIAVATAATDNVAAAALAADKMAALIGGSGQVGIIVHDQAGRSGAERRDGFINEMRKRHPGVQIIGPQYGEGDPMQSSGRAKAMIQDNPGIKGMFGASEDAALGIVKAVQDLDMAGRLVVIGFGGGKAQVDAIRQGMMAGAVTEDPFRIGYKAVEAAVMVLRGGKVRSVIDTGFHWYDRTNVEDPSIAVLLGE